MLRRAAFGVGNPCMASFKSMSHQCMVFHKQRSLSIASSSTSTSSREPPWKRRFIYYREETDEGKLHA